jgi:hypothetical protein
MFGKSERIRIRVKNIGFKKFERVMGQLIAYPGQNPGIEKWISSIVNRVKWSDRNRIDLQDGYTCKKKNDDEFFSQKRLFNF